MTLPRRYEVDPRFERQALRLRAAAGAVALASGVWLLALPDLLMRGFGLAGVVFGALWLLRWQRTRPTTAAYLELGHDALVREEHGRREVVPWCEIEDIDVDEDRLVVRVERAGRDPLVLEPRYGLALYALRDELRLVWKRVLE